MGHIPWCAHATDRFINGTRTFIVRLRGPDFPPTSSAWGPESGIAIKNTPKDDQVPRFTWRYECSLLDFLGESGASMLAQIRRSIRDPFRFFLVSFSLSLSQLSACFFRFLSSRFISSVERELDSKARWTRDSGVDARIIVAVSLLVDARGLCIPTL